MSDALITRRGGGGLTGIALIYCAFPTDADPVTCSNGTKTYTVPEKWLSSGGYCFAVNAEGTWTLTAKKGTTDSAAKTVDVQAGQQYMVELTFRAYYYNAGDKCESITGGYTNYNIKNGKVTYNKSNITTYNKSNITIQCGWGQSAAIRTTNRVDLSKINTLYFKIKGQADSYDYGRGGISTTEQAPKPGTSWVAYFNPNSPSTQKTYSLDVSNASGSYYIACGISDGNESSSTYEIESIWGEK